MDVKIRNARIGDLDALVLLLCELFSIEADFEVDTQRQRRGLALMLDGCGKHRCVKVAQVEGEIVGMCTAQILISTAEGGVVALIEDMVVDRRYRKMGIGRKLLKAIYEWAVKHGVKRLQLLADRTNFSALEFYNAMGWHPTQLICLRKKWKKS